ncbi:hypothetical protein ACHQM5_008047 [Ranunculus cassubicifolius]
MGRWLRPEVYPLLGAMTFVTSMVAFQLTRNVLLNPAVRVDKKLRKTAILENEKEGEKYAQHRFRKFLRTQSPEVMTTLNQFFATEKNK